MRNYFGEVATQCLTWCYKGGVPVATVFVDLKLRTINKVPVFLLIKLLLEFHLKSLKQLYKLEIIIFVGNDIIIILQA